MNDKERDKIIKDTVKEYKNVTLNHDGWVAIVAMARVKFREMELAGCKHRGNSDDLCSFLELDYKGVVNWEAKSVTWSAIEIIKSQAAALEKIALMVDKVLDAVKEKP